MLKVSISFIVTLYYLQTRDVQNVIHGHKGPISFATRPTELFQKHETEIYEIQQMTVLFAFFKNC